jgi:hypothetical protein
LLQRRDQKQEVASGLQRVGHICDGPPVIFDMFDHVAANHRIGAAGRIVGSEFLRTNIGQFEVSIGIAGAGKRNIVGVYSTPR